MLITVITPSYMQGAFIKDCIESVKNQSYKQVEHIVLDACSTDETDTVVRSYLGTYKLLYIAEPDKGQANAINKGLELAKGDIVCWLNSDDLFHHDQVLEKIVTLFQQQPEVDVITGGGVFVTIDGEWMEDIPVEPRVDQLTFMKRTCLTLQPSTFWRRNDIRLDESLHYAFDWKFFLDMLLAGKRFLPIEDHLSQYRVHGESKTQQDLAKRKKEVIKVNRYAQNGPLQTLWNVLIYQLFAISEGIKVPAIKRLANFLNRVAYSLSGGYIYST